MIQAGLAGVRGKEILPSPVDKSSRLVKDEEKHLTRAVLVFDRGGRMCQEECIFTE